jgi:cell division protein FtsI/penicillin-binding protein 2
LPAQEAHSDAVHASRPSHQFWRLWLVVFGFGFLTLIVVARLLHHQVVGWLNQTAAPTYSDSGLPRGVIVDRNGELLAADRFFYRIVADPANIQHEQDRLAVANALQELVGAPATETHARLFNNVTSRYLELAKLVSLAGSQQVEAYKTAAIEENATSPWQHIYVMPAPTRYYPQGGLASHILGFVQANRTGVYGLEGYYNSFLNAQSGVGLLARTSDRLEDLAPDLRRFVPSMGGKDLVLTLDSGVQWIIEEELQKAIAKYRAKGGSIVVMEPHSGAILAMTSWPAYDPNNYGQQPDFSLFVDPAISLLYEPGSIFKFVTMAAALDTGVIAPTTMYTDSGSVTVGQRLIFNSNRVGYGLVSATDALARSLNVVTAQIAVQLGSEKFYRYVERFGFDQLTEVDLAGEVPGLVKAPGDPQWSLSDLGTNSFGQGLAVTPLEMLNAVAAIANGGFLMRPHIVQTRIEGDRVLYTRPTVVRPVIKPETAQVLTEMMVETVRTGNEAAGIAGYRIAGKSGTAQIPGEGGYLQDATIVSFIGFAPADEPRFVVLIKLDQPDPGISIWATHTAAPVFAQVTRRLFDHLNIPPDTIRLGPERLAEIEAESTRMLAEKLPED